MLIDIVLLILVLLAIFKGYSKGLVLAAFSFAGIIFGLATAVKFSAIVARALHEYTHLSIGWLPFLAFLLIIIGVWILIRIVSKIIEASLELVLLGWLNRLAGVLLFALLYATVFSIILFYAHKLHLLNTSMISGSKTYSYIEPLGPKCIELFGKIIPIFKGAFDELSAFFERLTK